MRVIYPSGKDALLRGDVDMLADTIKVALVSGYVYDAADTVIADIGAIAAPGVIVSVTDVSGGRALCADVVFNNLSGANVIDGLIIYRDPDVLLGYCSQRADTTPVSVTPNGGDVTFSFDFLIKI
jgi:hypothetical protein